MAPNWSHLCQRSKLDKPFNLSCQLHHILNQSSDAFDQKNPGQHPREILPNYFQGSKLNLKHSIIVFSPSSFLLNSGYKLTKK